MPKYIDLAGQRFGRLRVESYHGTNGRTAEWRCQCDCGRLTITTSHGLRFKGVRSCGCLTIDKTIERSTTHGQSKRTEYVAWRNMKQRCSNPKSPIYRYYGGRGIRVCEQWAGDYEAFIADMGPCPSGHTLDRIDTDGHYEPQNCRWATRSVQQRNKRPFNRH